MRAVRYLLLLLALLGSQILVGVYLVMNGSLPPVPAYLLISFGVMPLMFALGADMIVGGYTIGFLTLGQRIRAAKRDAMATVPSAFQPDAGLAMLPGETLSLAVRRVHAHTARTILQAAALVLLFGGAGMIVIFSVLPDFSQSQLNPFTLLLPLNNSSLIKTPNTLDWIVLLCPLFWMGTFSWLSVNQHLSSLRSIVFADDRGVTVKRAFHRDEFLPWEHVTVFLWPGVAQPANEPFGGYILIGHKRNLRINITRIRADDFIFDNTKTANTLASALSSYVYEGGQEAYTANARCLLATIIVRSHTPLRVFTTQPSFLRLLFRRFPGRFLTIQQIESMPFAGAPWQPNPKAVEEAMSARGRIVARPRLRFWATFRAVVAGLLVALLLVTFATIIAAPAYSADSFSVIPSVTLPGALTLSPTAIIGLAAGAFLYLLSIPVAVVYAIQRQRTRFPIMIADDVGVTRITLGQSSAMTIPWSAIKAWGIIPPSSSSKMATYMLFTDTGKLIWRESEDAQLAGHAGMPDRLDAYRAQAEHFHALIVARTRLALREITSDLPTQA